MVRKIYFSRATKSKNGRMPSATKSLRYTVQAHLSVTHLLAVVVGMEGGIGGKVGQKLVTVGGE